MQGKIKFALVGCGRIADNHAFYIKQIKEAELVAVCDLKPERAKELSEKYNVPYYLNYNKMLKDNDVDVVNIITPSGMHPEHAVDIISKYKKHLVIEKPVFLNMKDGLRIKTAALNNKIKIFPVLQNRYNKAVKKVKKGLDSGEFGKLVFGAVRLLWSRGQSYYDRDPWRGTWALDGGVLTNQAIHHLDLLRWFFGDVEWVEAIGATQLVNIEVEDTAIVNIKFKNGALGSIIASTAIRPDDLEASISVFGEKGRASINGTAVNKLTEWTLNNEDIKEYQVDIPNVYGFGHLNFFEDVVRDLSIGVSHPISFEDAAQTIELLNAVYCSIEQKRSVCLKDKYFSKRLGRKDKKLMDIYITKDGD